MDGKKLETLRRGVISHSKSAQFTSPFHEIFPLFLDTFASSPAHESVESFIHNKVLPFLSNTHTQTSFTGKQSISFLAEARQKISEFLKLNNKIHTLLFAGSNATSCVNSIAKALCQPNVENIIFLGPFSHHSSLLPWIENGFSAVYFLNDPTSGIISIKHFTYVLKTYMQTHPTANKIVCLSAASNVTGHLIPMKLRRKLNQIAHKLGCLIVWDFAAAAPYLDINLTGSDHDLPDAIYLSPHKFLGGNNTPGILAIKKGILKHSNTSNILDRVGGGTVFWVKETEARLKSDVHERQEGGTPDVVGAVRAALAFQLKDSFNLDGTLHDRESAITSKALSRLKAIQNLKLLGTRLLEEAVGARLSVYSFMIKHDSGKFLHYNFVCALLNDLFGIQSRGGCMCAGPYAQMLLGLDTESVDLFEACLLEAPKENELLRPGFSRISLPWYLSHQQVNYALDAVEFVAAHGHKFLYLYRFDCLTGLFAHKKILTKSLQRTWLDDFDCAVSGFEEHNFLSAEEEASHFKENLAFARSFVEKAKRLDELPDQGYIFDVRDEMIWFVMPEEATRAGQVTSKGCLINPDMYITLLNDKYTNFVSKLDVGDDDLNVEGISAELRPGVKLEKKEKYTRKKLIRHTEEVSDNEEKSAKTDEVVCFLPRSKDFVFKNEELHFLNPNPSTMKKIKIPNTLLKFAGKAINDWKLIQEGDRILLGLSGGKDSLAMFHLLKYFQSVAPIKFTFACCTIDPMTNSFDPSSLIPYMEKQGVEYFYVKNPIFENAKQANPSSICSYCARFKRGILYSICSKHGFNKLALAQHLDDNVETMLMSLMHNGQLRAMKSKYSTKEVIKSTKFPEKNGQVIEVIRPVCYVREKDLKNFSYSAGLPVISENCPACFEDPKERQRMKKLLKREESYNSNIFNNCRRALTPLMSPRVLQELSNFNNTLPKREKMRNSGKANASS